MKMIITGVTGGLGTALVKLADKAGHEVVGISRSKPDGEIKYTHIKADLTNRKDLDMLIEKIQTDHADFDVLINNAGVLNVKNEKDLDYAELDTLFALNIQAPIYLTSKLLAGIVERGADVVNIGSTIGFKAYEDQAAYGSSKWAVRGFNEFLKLKFKGTKARVIGFNPGGFESRIFEKATGVKNTDWDGWMKPESLAMMILRILELPKSMEVSDITINRK